MLVYVPLVFGIKLNVNNYWVSPEGKVGIGTNDPLQHVHVRSSGAFGNPTVRLENPAKPMTWDITADDAGVLAVKQGGVNARLSVEDTGDVGIGTASPDYRMDVLTTASSTGRFKSSSGAPGTLVDIDNSVGQSTVLRFSDGAVRWFIGMDAAGDAFKIGKGSYFGSGDEYLTITPTGMVGIGTSTPSVNLDVAGRIRATAPGTGNAMIHLWQQGTGGKEYSLYSTGSGDPLGAGVFSVYDGNAHRLVIKNGRIGIGRLDPAAPLDVAGNIRVEDIYAHNVELQGYLMGPQSLGRLSLYGDVDAGVSEGVHLLDNGNVGIGTNAPTEKVDIHGNAIIRGTLSATVKNFDIPHPLDPNMRLLHSSLEGPEAGVYYRGEGQLLNGRTEIKLPDYFEALTQKEGRTVILTNIDGFDRLAIQSQTGIQVKDGSFIVYSDNPRSTQRFTWEVKAMRADVAWNGAEVSAEENS